MPKILKTLDDPLVLEAALEGLELQKSRIEAQILEIRNRLGKRSRTQTEPAHNSGKKRSLSPEARKRIATAQKKRWAEYRKSTANSN
jgi:hypothetical protein